jgi:hypothetical protein
VSIYALDGVANAEEGSEYMEYCQRLWAADRSVLDPTGELYQRPTETGHTAGVRFDNNGPGPLRHTDLQKGKEIGFIGGDITKERHL